MEILLLLALGYVIYGIMIGAFVVFTYWAHGIYVADRFALFVRTGALWPRTLWRCGGAEPL